ncbi:MAG: UvrD-helicase domain-containing protein, partial [Planctomycetaceae bacterium]|nr:UvrD-helicase domain-containing protein [Planctomycetaceae bacterium]
MSSTDALNSVLSKLNPAQRAAACHGRSPLLIIAGAGTGKTTTLAHRVAALVARGVDPARMLLLTFTRRASAELLRRAQGIVKEFNDASDSTEGENQTGAQVSGAALNRVWGGTFHSVAARLLRRFGKLIGVP